MGQAKDSEKQHKKDAIKERSGSCTTESHAVARCTINSNADADSSNTKDCHQKGDFQTRKQRMQLEYKKNTEITVKSHTSLKLGDKMQPEQNLCRLTLRH